MRWIDASSRRASAPLHNNRSWSSEMELGSRDKGTLGNCQICRSRASRTFSGRNGWKADIEANGLFGHARFENREACMTIGLAVYAALAATTFNLNCSGLIESTSVEAGKNVQPFSTTFRIDLASKRWCEGACTSARDIARFDDNSIILQWDSTGAGLPHTYNRMSYIRGTPTGYYSEFRTSVPDREHVYFFRREGRCTEGQFTGFGHLLTP